MTTCHWPHLRLEVKAGGTVPLLMVQTVTAALPEGAAPRLLFTHVVREFFKAPKLGQQEKGTRYTCPMCPLLPLKCGA